MEICSAYATGNTGEKPYGIDAMGAGPPTCFRRHSFCSARLLKESCRLDSPPYSSEPWVRFVVPGWISSVLGELFIGEVQELLPIVGGYFVFAWADVEADGVHDWFLQSGQIAAFKTLFPEQFIHPSGSDGG